MLAVIISLVRTARLSLRSRALLQLEILALRHQLQVLDRLRPRRVHLTQADRLFWVWLSKVWAQWRSAVVIVKRKGVALFREAERTFATGGRVQFTAPFREQHVANRELGTIDHINASGQLRVRLESGRCVAFALGLGEQLVNRRLAYVPVSRGRYDAQIYTDDKRGLAHALARDVTHRTAVEVAHLGDSAEPSRGQSPTLSRTAQLTLDR
jgi:hypothetical protein